MTTTLIFLSKVVFATILLLATVISTIVVAPFAFAGWLTSREKLGQ